MIGFWLIVTVGFAVANLRQPPQERAAAPELSDLGSEPLPEQLQAQRESESSFDPGERPADFLVMARGGRQWIVSLAPRFRVIFDGKELGVGREPEDLSAIDLDHDGVFEVVAPVTDFYAFHDKMSMSDIPLPYIVFKYNPAEETYLPANSIYRVYGIENLEEVPTVDPSLRNEFHHRGAVLNNVLIHIYAGDETHAWNYFDQHYQLDDKEEIRRRVKEIQRTQRVYNLIYKTGKKK